MECALSVGNDSRQGRWTSAIYSANDGSISRAQHLSLVELLGYFYARLKWSMTLQANKSTQQANSWNQS